MLRRLTRVAGSVLVAAALLMPASANGASLTARIAKVVRSSAVGSSSAVYVWDQSSRNVIYARYAARVVTPASNMKLLTGAAALTKWGEDKRFTTRLFAAGTQVGSTWAGSIYMVGGGDPVLSTAGFARDNYGGYANATNIAGLVSGLVSRGIDTVHGRIYVNGSAFDDQHYVAAWPRSFRYEESGSLGGLTVNQSLLGKYVGGRSAIRPDIQAGVQLRAALDRAGITVDGAIVPGSVPADATELAHVDSPRLIDIIDHMNEVSDNFVAETLLKDLSADANGGADGSTLGGVRGGAQLLRSIGVNVSGLTWTDGSGLAGTNRVTARMIGQVLGVGAQMPWGPDWIAGMATSGGHGTLRHRMTRHPYRGRVHGKTGTLHNSSALSGFVDNVDGTHRYGFSVITYTARRNVPISAAHNLQNHIAQVLVR